MFCQSHTLHGRVYVLTLTQYFKSVGTVRFRHSWRYPQYDLHYLLIFYVDYNDCDRYLLLYFAANTNNLNIPYGGKTLTQFQSIQMLKPILYTESLLSDLCNKLGDTELKESTDCHTFGTEEIITSSFGYSYEKRRDLWQR